MKFSSLFSGSSGNSTFIASDHAKILVDAGVAGKNIEKALSDINEDPSKVDAIFITHEHTDHIKGIGVISRRYDIPIYANCNTWEEIDGKIGKIKENNIKIIDEFINIKDMTIKRFDTPHDSISSSGFVMETKGKKVSVVTDIGYFTSEIRNNIKDSEVILLESNHDVEMVKFGPYPYNLKKRVLSNVGHLSNEDCGRAILEILGNNKKKILLGHLSKENNHPDLALETVKSILVSEGVNIDAEVILEIAKRDVPSGYIQF